MAPGETPLFDPTAARMMAASSELASEHPTALDRPAFKKPTVEPAEHNSAPAIHKAPVSELVEHAPAPLVRRIPADTEPTPSLAKSTTPLPPEEQKHFGPQSAGRHYDPRMIQAARIARQRAEPHMTFLCWRYVKDALVEAGVVDSRPATAYAKEAGRELCQRYGFVKLHVSDPLAAPVGAVVVYGGKDAGHVELRTEHGFASDFISRTPYPRPLVGVFVKPS